ncbi:MAG: ATP-binding protein, partial [Allobranchiibius sp.]
TGLGLAIVKHVASGHGGEVSVWSAEGQGSTFTLLLPVPPSTLDTTGPTDLVEVPSAQPEPAIAIGKARS